MSTVLYIVYWLILIYIWLIIGRALFSWFPVRFGGPAFRIKELLFVVTEPYLGRLRRLIPSVRIGMIGLDLSAMVGVIVLAIVSQVLIRLL